MIEDEEPRNVPTEDIPHNFWGDMSATQWSLLNPTPLKITLEDFQNCRPLLPRILGLGYGFAPRIAERYMLGNTDMILWQEHVQPLQPENINFVDIIGGDYLQVKFVYRPNGSVMAQIIKQKYYGKDFYPMFGKPGSVNSSNQKFRWYQGIVKDYQMIILNADAWRLALNFEMRGYGILEVRLSTFELEEAQLPVNAYHLIPLLYEAIYEYNIAMEKYESIQYGGKPEDRLYRRYSGKGGVMWCPYMPLVSTPPYTAEQHETLMLKREVESLKKRVAQLEKDCHIEFDDVPPEEEE